MKIVKKQTNSIGKTKWNILQCNTASSSCCTVKRLVHHSDYRLDSKKPRNKTKKTQTCCRYRSGEITTIRYTYRYYTEQCCKQYSPQKLVFKQSTKYLWSHYLNNMSRVFGQLEIHISNTQFEIVHCQTGYTRAFSINFTVNVYTTVKR